MEPTVIQGSICPDVVNQIRVEYGERVVAFRPHMARAVGGIYAALLLQQLMYWSSKHDTHWIWHTGVQIEEETALTPDQQLTARRILVAKGLIQEKRMGLPAKMYFHVQWQEVADILSSYNRPKLESDIPETVIGDPGNCNQEIPKHIRVSKEIKEIDNVPPPKNDPLAGFEEFYAAYPRKENPEDARKAWKQVGGSLDLWEAIRKDVSRRLQSKEWEQTKERRRFIPYPATYLRAGGWKGQDEVVEDGGEWDTAKLAQMTPEQLSRHFGAY